MVDAISGNIERVKFTLSVLSQIDKLGDMSCMDNSDYTKLLCVARNGHTENCTTNNPGLSKR